MRLKSFLRRPSAWRVGLILLGIMASLVAGAFTLVWGSPLAPLVVGGAVVATAIGIVSLQNPVCPLYILIFLDFLPVGLIPSNLHAILGDSVLLLALFSWLIDVGFRRRRIVWASTSLLMVCFLTWCLFTLSWAPNLIPGRRVLVQSTLNLVLCLILIVNEIDSLQTLDGLMNTLALNGWVLVLAGIGTLLRQGYAFGTQLVVLEMNENEFGISLIMTMPGVLWRAMRSSERQRALRMSQSFIFTLLAIVLTVLSGSRGSAISLLATLLACWFWKPTRPWGKLGLLISAMVVIGAPFILSTLVDRFLGGDLLGGRIELWRAGWLLIRDHLLWGVGVGNGDYAMPSYLRTITNRFSYRSRYVPAHNPVLQVWIDTGLIGILLYLSVLGSAVWSFVRQYGQCRQAGRRSLTPYFALVSCVFVGYMLSWFKSGGLHLHSTYFLLLALLLIPSHLDIESLSCTMESDVQDVKRK
jgi:putative inorganic carbon (HCO3(-)) transporter